MLKDKVAIITGGTRGIGFEIAKVFLENHAKVIILGSRKESVEKGLDQLNQAGFKAEGHQEAARLFHQENSLSF